MAVVLKTIGLSYFDGRSMAALAGRELELMTRSSHCQRPLEGYGTVPFTTHAVAAYERGPSVSPSK
jgi:hypothetical protein